MFKKLSSLTLLVLLSLTITTQLVYAFPWSYNMWKQPSIKPYEQPMEYPENSVTTDGTRLKPVERQKLEAITKNPQPFTKESVERGNKEYHKLCVVCHGPDAKGNGIIVTKGHGFYPVDLTSQTVRDRTDGYIYAYIMYGGKVMMPAYGESVTEQNAWDIINYVRSLEGKEPTTTAEENK